MPASILPKAIRSGELKLSAEPYLPSTPATALNVWQDPTSKRIFIRDAAGGLCTVEPLPDLLLAAITFGSLPGSPLRSLLTATSWDSRLFTHLEEQAKQNSGKIKVKPTLQNPPSLSDLGL